jgi:predicted nucleic acid-binding protein
VVSFLFKSHPLAPVYHDILAGRPLAISLITLGEIEYGMEIKNWGAPRRDLMRRYLDPFTLLLPEAETARLWASVKSSCERKGRPIASADAWIAATALYLVIPLVTHNAADYRAIDGLTVLTAHEAP